MDALPFSPLFLTVHFHRTDAHHSENEAREKPPKIRSCYFWRTGKSYQNLFPLIFGGQEKPPK
jgi:hypothetical protein